MTLGAIAVVFLCAVLLHLYERFAGEHPLFDAIYDRRLRRMSLDALERRHRANTNRADVVISLTTLPSRLDRLELTLKSLLNQTISPAVIRLNLPETSRREQRPYVVPDWLARLQSVTICRCEDFGPVTKLLPTLRAASSEDERIIVVDDDRIYHRHFVEQLVRSADANPGAAIASSGWDAPPDLIDRPSTLLATIMGRPPVPIKCTRVRGVRRVDIMQGLSGYLVTPRFFDVAALAEYSGAPEAAFFVDDVWISAHCRAPKVIVGGRRTNFQSEVDTRFYQKTSLGRVNRGDGRPESRNNTIMLQFFADRWGAARAPLDRSIRGAAR